MAKSRKEKERLSARFLRFRTQENKIALQSYTKTYKKLLRAAKFSYYDKKFKESSNDIKTTWKLINEVVGKTQVHKKLPDTFIHNGVILNDEQNIADGFNEFFSNIGANLAKQIVKSGKNVLEFMPQIECPSFVFNNVTPEILMKAANELQNKTSQGPDFISTKLMKEILTIIVQPICYLFTLSFKTGYIPLEFKTAKIIPIFKSEDPQSFNNYRPISLLSSFSKLLEKIVSIQMFKFIDKYSILYQHQYGFRKKHSTLHPIVHFLDNIFHAQNSSSPKPTLGIFLDLKKAFDTVDFSILLKKLDYYGFKGVTNLWFSNYLTNRFQYVSLGTFHSKMLPILCGVPQGSILGPLLFLLYINDMPNCTNFFTLLFADDTTLQLTSNNTDTLFQLANTELTKVNDWFSRNALTLNVKKTKYILFHTPRMAIDLPLPTLKINNSKIDRIHSNDTGDGSFKFVGMHLDEHLSWSKHVDNLVKKLNFACFTISRIKNILPLLHPKNPIYDSFPKPSGIWNFSLRGNL